jgi:hypothetical protein
MENSGIVNKYLQLRSQLMNERNQKGFWTGELATSALSTAVAVVALKVAGHESDRERVHLGFEWLLGNINADGGYGDTTESVSNVSTTLLVYSALKFCQTGQEGVSALKAIEKWLSERGIDIGSDTITKSILKFYGNDYTFSVPIISMLSLCGSIPSSSMEKIPQLPFELALLPSSFYRFLNLRVVSYALPALIGVGIYEHMHHKNRLAGRLRNLFIKPSIRKLTRLVPPSGGFLEAIPLTGFVSMCLISSGIKENTAVQKGIEFLRMQQRKTGGWPIDTDLSTWVTTLSIKALGTGIYQVLNEQEIRTIRNHIIGLQLKEKHPFNGAKPGGWGWTNYSGSVPDADDTPGAIIALLGLYSGSKEELSAISNGCRWLMELQNRDGGFPTFCKGWSKLPFDKSSADLTGHALLALLMTIEKLGRSIPQKLCKKIRRSTFRAVAYLNANQSDEGAWLPLWFGNQLTDDQSNPTYGSAKVCTYLTDCLKFKQLYTGIRGRLAIMTAKAHQYLLNQQNSDGSWGGKKDTRGTIEETSLAVCALADGNRDACLKGISWLEKQEKLTASPIGLYFALLWYDEKMYPLIYQTEALRRFLEFS